MKALSLSAELLRQAPSVAANTLFLVITPDLRRIADFNHRIAEPTLTRRPDQTCLRESND